jgi:hypothetical protein
MIHTHSCPPFRYTLNVVNSFKNQGTPIDILQVHSPVLQVTVSR